MLPPVPLSSLDGEEVALTHQHASHGHSVPGSPGDAWEEESLVSAFVEQTTAHAEQRRAPFDFVCDLLPFEPDAAIKVLDIGSGYGALAEAVLDHFPNAIAVGLDVSEPMMAVGRQRMAGFGNRFSYHVGDFAGGELPSELPGPFDAALASAAILHLSSQARQRLYRAVFGVLSPGGCFFNVEPVAPPNEEMEAWYRERRARQFQRGRHQPAPRPEHSLMLHHQFESEEAFQEHQRHHHLETEANQLALLRSAGFVRADCFFKQLLDTVIGGYKPTGGGQ
jgi:tRNA (cmo5U34)-methyltransferase